MTIVWISLIIASEDLGGDNRQRGRGEVLLQHWKLSSCSHSTREVHRVLQEGKLLHG